MKALILLPVLALPLLLSGCTTSNAAKLAAALAKDPATVHLRVTSIYGVIEFSRTAPTSNSLAHTISPDGTISVK